MVIDSKKEQDWMDQVAPNNYLWMSLNDYDDDDRWQWERADGSMVELMPENVRWAVNQPDDARPEEQCVIARLGMWYDVHCSENREFVCERTESGACFHGHKLHSLYSENPVTTKIKVLTNFIW